MKKITQEEFESTLDELIRWGLVKVELDENGDEVLPGEADPVLDEVPLVVVGVVEVDGVLEAVRVGASDQGQSVVDCRVGVLDEAHPVQGLRQVGTWRI